MTADRDPTIYQITAVIWDELYRMLGVAGMRDFDAQIKDHKICAFRVWLGDEGFWVSVMPEVNREAQRDDAAPASG